MMEILCLDNFSNLRRLLFQDIQDLFPGFCLELRPFCTDGESGRFARTMVSTNLGAKVYMFGVAHSRYPSLLQHLPCDSAP